MRRAIHGGRGDQSAGTRGGSDMRRLRCILPAFFLLAAGCGVNSTFVYKPAPAGTAGAKLPVKLAVLPFKDGTEDFTKRGTILDPEHLTFNLAKAGVTGSITALTPEFWAKAFADDMAASGDFRSVRFVFDRKEITDEDYYIEGTVDKAYEAGAWTKPSEYALSLRALRRTGGEAVWEKQIVKVRPGYAMDQDPYRGCRLSPQCMIDRLHGFIREMMREMFAEARADLVKTLAFAGAGGERSGATAASAGPFLAEDQYVGVGLEVRGAALGLEVVRVLEGSAAARAGLAAGDTVVAVDGRSVAGTPLAEAVARIRGLAGTQVTLSVTRAGWTAPRDFVILRELIERKPSAAPDSVEKTIERILKEK